VRTGKTQSRIIVGVDGSGVSRQAVLWAAEEARLRRSELLITHVEAAVTAANEGLASLPAQKPFLVASAAAASHREPAIAVGTLQLRGDPTEELIRLSKTSGVLVIGIDRTRPRLGHGALGPLEDRILVHAHCPIVTISDAPKAPSDQPSVVVGWTPNKTGRRALEAGAAEADLRSCSLTVINVFPLTRSTNVVDGVANAEAALRDSAETIMRRYPGLPVSVRKEDRDGAQALLWEAGEAQLLVIGCRRSEDRWSVRTGTVVETAMRAARCPVMLVVRLPPRSLADVGG
jgi:nucleotide-binding universal stress UspA family protein